MSVAASTGLKPTVSFAGYTLTQLLHERPSTAIWRGVRNADSAPVILKTQGSDFPTARDLAKLRHEHAILRELEGPGIVPVAALETSGARLALVMEDVGLRSLDQLSGTRLSLGLVLRIALAVLSVLQRAHQRRILHKDIKPHNLLVSAAPLRVYVIDWGIASRLREVHQEDDGSPLLAEEGTAAYLAPEQTGIVNRSVDVRTDLYSLGVTLYELLTGTLPFTDTDPAALMHSHLTRAPTPPHEVDARVPLQVSAVVMKLLAKSAEDRYASARGLERDIAECLSQWEQRGEISPFVLGRLDRSSDFRIPQKLYGREAELAAVLAALGRVERGTAELLLLTGYGGIGKSALVREARVSMRLRGARVVSGKFEQFRDPVPYASLIQAFRELTRQIMAERAGDLARHRQRLSEALGPNAGVLCELVPELERVIGSQPPVPALGPIEAEHRFHLAIQQFVSVFAIAERPLVLFLDDLQWAESASLKLIDRLLTDPQLGHLLIIGAYRDHDRDAIQLLTRAVGSLAETPGKVTRIELRPLGLVDVSQLLADALHTTEAQVEALSAEIHRKTEGNPFFVSQLLTSLAQDGLIAFDEDRASWRWDLRAIADRSVTENVAEFMAQRIRRLRPATQELLKLGAALGAEFDHATLSQIGQQSIPDCARSLWEALVEGLLVPLHDDYRLLRDVESTSDVLADQVGDAWAVAARVSYRFQHDRVQEAAYALLEERERPGLHLRIARLLRAQSAGEIAEDRVFTIVDHLNIGRAVIEDRGERLAAAELNLRAGRRAKSSVAFAAARAYLAAGIAHLPEDAWEGAFELSFALRIEHAELLFVGGDAAEAEVLFGELLERTASITLQAEVHALRVKLYSAVDRYLDAVRLGRLALAQLGAPLPETPEAAKSALEIEIEKVTARLGEHAIDDLIAARPTTDPRLRLIAKLLVLLDGPANTDGPDLSALISCRQVLLSLEHGPSELSAYGYASCALLFLRLFGRTREVEQLSRLAAAFQERYPSPEYTSKVSFLLAGAVAVFKPIAEAAAHYHAISSICLQHGDLLFFVYSFNYSINMYILAVDEELDALKARFELFLATSQRVRAEMASMTCQLALRVIACLRGETQTPWSLDDDRFDEDAFLTHARGKNMQGVLGSHLTYRLMLLYLNGEHDAAAPLLEEAAAKQAVSGSIQRTLCFFYICLHLCALLERAPAPPHAARYEAMLDEYHGALAKRRALCEEAWRCPDLLIAAERARLRGDDMAALGLYNQAIELAQQDGLARLFALGNELHGKFSLRRGHRKMACVCLSDAYQTWLRWGAKIKAEALWAQHPDYVTWTVASQPSATTTSNTTRRTSTAILQGVLFDLGEAMRAAHSISSEIAEERVIERFLRACSGSAAAERAFVVLEQGGELWIAGQWTTSPETFRSFADTPLAGTTELSESVVRYVAHSQEAVALGSKDPAELFLGDPYLRDHRPRSLLCLPLIHTGRLVGVWYGESRAAGGLRRGSLELLQMLASQAASALVNARLYERLEDTSEQLMRANDHLEAEVQKRTAELRETHQRLVQLEKDATEVQMAGGFAHEMRNVMVSVLLSQRAAYTPEGESLCMENRAALEQLFRQVRADLRQEALESLAALLRKIVDNERRLDEILGIIDGAVGRALRVTDTILAYSKLGREHPGDELVPLRPLVASILAEEAAELSEHQIEAKVGIPEELALRGKESHLAAMLRHLVQNGRDALVDKQGAGPRELRIAAVEEPDRWVLRIEDTGIGIAPALQGQIFAPFFSTRPATGMGLGLSMVEKLVRLYQGAIHFESEVGRGTAFTITLPMRRDVTAS